MNKISSPGMNKYLLRTLLLFSPFFLVSLVALLFFLSLYIRLDMENISNSQKLILELQKKKTDTGFSEIFADIHFLTETAVIKDYCHEPILNFTSVKSLLYYFIKDKRIYDQIRMLGLDGKEIARVNYNNGDPFLVPKAMLQDKSDRYYYQKALTLPPNTVYISNLDLNVENGEIEKPEKPTIRFTMPIYNEHGEMQNLFVFNYNAKQLLEEIRDYESISYGRIMMLNRDAQWLISNDKSQEFAFMKGDTSSFQQKNPDVWRHIYLNEQGSMQSDKGLFFHTTLRPVPTLASAESEIIDLSLSRELKYMPGSYEWKLVTFVPQSYLDERYSRVTTFAYSIFISANIAFFIACLFIAVIKLNSTYRDNIYKQMLEEYVSELNKKSDELQKNVTEIQELVHILCHDLLNPISCVIGMMEYYNDPNEMAEVMDAEGKELIVESLEQAINIIQMVRTMRALDSGKQKLSIQPVNLSSSLKTSLRMLRHRLTDKGITITSDVDKNHNVMAEEASLINSVMSNLITNSIKFSMEGSAVEIISQKDGEKVYMHVIDHGQGMSEEILKYIFDPSKPTTRPGTDGEKGTGFGMPLVKKFMEAYGGSISISSTLRKSGSDRHGTKITLTFKSAD